MLLLKYQSILQPHFESIEHSKFSILLQNTLFDGSQSSPYSKSSIKATLANVFVNNIEVVVVSVSIISSSNADLSFWLILKYIKKEKYTTKIKTKTDMNFKLCVFWLLTLAPNLKFEKEAPGFFFSFK